jgi:hypothetical protein
LFIPLVGAYIHEDFIAFLEGLDFTIFNFAFIDFEEIPGLKTFSNLFSTSLNSGYFKNIGVEYESTFKNLAGTIIMLLIIMVTHILIIMPVYLCSLKLDSDSNKRVFAKKLFLSFTFATYIRMILESYVFITICVLSELRSVGVNASISILVFLGIILICFFIGYYKSLKEEYEVDESYAKEYFAALKPNTLKKLFYFVFIIRRIATGVLIISCSFLNMYIKIIGMVIIHSFVFVIILVTRPFNGIVDNIVEILNDFSYAVIL